METPACRSLRTKKSRIPALRSAEYLAEQEPYQQYFCLRTLHAVGPDDDMVCPAACTRERPCYRPLPATAA